MTRKTGAKAVKARQLARAARLIKQKQKLREAGISLGLPKPSREATKQEEEELKKLYLELLSKKERESGKSEQSQEQTERPVEEAQEQLAQTEQT